MKGCASGTHTAGNPSTFQEINSRDFSTHSPWTFSDLGLSDALTTCCNGRDGFDRRCGLCCVGLCWVGLRWRWPRTEGGIGIWAVSVGWIGRFVGFHGPIAPYVRKIWTQNGYLLQDPVQFGVVSSNVSLLLHKIHHVSLLYHINHDDLPHCKASNLLNPPCLFRGIRPIGESTTSIFGIVSNIKRWERWMEEDGGRSRWFLDRAWIYGSSRLGWS